MQLPLLVIYETDGRLAAALRPLAEQHKWLLREARQLTACLRLFARGRPGVLVLRLSRDRERELEMLERLAWLYPDARTLLVADNDPAQLASLAWDLGVRWVFLPPYTRERLGEFVTSLMRPDQPEGPAGGPA
jgi:DNA-binding NarL/FixJ family response regulator